MRFETKYQIGDWIRFKHGGNVVDGKINRVEVVQELYRINGKDVIETFITYKGYIDDRQTLRDSFDVYEMEVMKKLPKAVQETFEEFL